jgi:hypothetical protein
VRALPELVDLEAHPSERREDFLETMGKDVLAIGDRGRRSGITRGRKDERLWLCEIR